MAWAIIAIAFIVGLAALFYLWQAFRFGGDLQRVLASSLVAILSGLVIWFMWPASSSTQDRIAQKPIYDRPAPPPVEQVIPDVVADDDYFDDEDGYEDEIEEEYVPPPVTETLVEDSLIYFPLDSAMLVCEAREQLREVARFVRSHQTIRIRISGHADTSGEATRNYDLSYERAETVRRHLIGVLKVAPQVIQPIQAAGEANPAEVTGDGVREQLNRRVEILVDYVPFDDAAYTDIPSVWFQSGMTKCPDSLNVPPPKPCPNCGRR